MTFAAQGLQERAAQVEPLSVTPPRPSPFLPPATFQCAVARAISEGFWNLRQETWVWAGLSHLSREVFYFVAAEVLLAAAAWRDAHDGQTIPRAVLAQVISEAFWAVCSEPARGNTWESQHQSHRLTWDDCAGRVLDVAANWLKARAA